MPRKTVKKVKRNNTENITPEILSSVVEESVTSKPSQKKLFILGLVVIVIVVLFFLLKSYFLAAVVNNHPIFRWQLDRELEKRYGTQILDNLVTEKLIDQEASKAKINITKADMDSEIKTVTASLPEGTDLATALKSEGLSMEDFTQQISIKLKAERILNPKITITDQELEDFASKSASLFTSSDSAKQKVEAETILRQQKLGDAFSAWLEEIKTKAKILKFSL